MKVMGTLPPFSDCVRQYQTQLRSWMDVAMILHLLAFIATLITGCVSDTLWLVASFLIGCLMVMIPFVTDAIIKGA